MSVGNFYKMVGELGWTTLGFTFFPDGLVENGLWVLEIPLRLHSHARQQIGRCIYIEGVCSDFICSGVNTLNVTHLLPPPAPSRWKRWLAMYQKFKRHAHR